MNQNFKPVLSIAVHIVQADGKTVALPSKCFTSTSTGYRHHHRDQALGTWGLLCSEGGSSKGHTSQRKDCVDSEGVQSR